MNRSLVAFMVGRILTVLALLLLIPLLVSFYYQESWAVQEALIKSFCITLACGLLLSIRKPKNMGFYVREGIVVTSLSWVLTAVFGAFPFFLSGAIPSFVDAFFESASGFTTTGSSILNHVEALPHSLLFWRSFTHFVGGMGVLVFALAILPRTAPQTVHLMKAEVPGPTFGKLLSRISSTARTLYIIYTVMTLMLIAILWACGMTVFDACVHAFGTAGTGGFSNHSTSVAYFNSPLIEVVLGIGMLVFGVNFNLYFFMLHRRFREVRQNDELRWYLGVVLGVMVLLLVSLRSVYSDPIWAVKDVFFTVSTIITTTGFGTIDFTQWPLISQLLLLFLMFAGGCAGSTAGGLKIVRIASMFRIAVANVRQIMKPRQMTVVKMEGRNLDANAQNAIGAYLILYVLTFTGIMALVSLENLDFMTTFSAVAGTFNNVGPGLGQVGPTSNFAFLSDGTKVGLALGMIAGRLEILPLLILFLPQTWRLK